MKKYILYGRLLKSNKYIKIPNLKPYHTYYILARNANIGIWCPERNDFLISRFKYGRNYLFGEIHWDADDTFGTAKPFEEIKLSYEDTNSSSRIKKLLCDYDNSTPKDSIFMLNYLNNLQREHSSILSYLAEKY